MAASEAFGEKTFTLNFDMQSFTVAMAVNLGYLSLDTLETAQTQYDPIVVLTDHTDTPNVTYSMSQYFDLRYASMAPIMCIRNLTHAPPNYMTELCMLELPLTWILYAVPIFNSGGILSGGDRYGYSGCSCSQDNLFDDNCNSFNLMSGLIFYNNDLFYAGDLFAMYLKVIGEYSSYYAFNEAMSPALYYIKMKINTYLEVDDANVTQEALQPCRGVPPGYLYPVTCSVVGVNTFSINSGNKQVSDYHYVLQT